MSQSEHEAPVPSTPAPVAWMEAAAARILNGLFHELADHSSPDRDRIAKRYAELRSVTNFSDAARTARHELIVSILSELARVSPSEGSAPAPPTDVREECARVCESRGRSLRESGQHGEANEAHKCAMAIRAHGFSDSFRPVPPSAPAPQEEAERIRIGGGHIVCPSDWIIPSAPDTKPDEREEIAALRAERDAMRHVVAWMLGEEGDFPPAPDDVHALLSDGRQYRRDRGTTIPGRPRLYWWRGELRDRWAAAISVGPDNPANLSNEPVSDTPDTGEGTEDTKLSRVSSSPPEGEDTQWPGDG